jgi:hypothetical protein
MQRPWSSIFLTRLVAPVWLALVLLAGCARKVEGPYQQTRAALSGLDDFGLLLLGAGLEPTVLPTGPELAVEEAAQFQLLLTLLLSDGSMQRYGPRSTASYLLAEVVAGGKKVPRAVLNERLRRFEHLTVLRPDGYLALGLTGAPTQCVGPVQAREGALMSGGYKLGVFYTADGTEFREQAQP